MKISDDLIICLECKNDYQVEEDIPPFFVPNEYYGQKEDVTDIVKSFYEKTPFPNYNQFENVSDFIVKAKRGIFARWLNEQVPLNIRVLEVGCGTGQLSNFLSTVHRSIFGVDICLNSLKLARNFKNENGLKRSGFYQMNLFRPIFKEETFPLVICNGVLHHTSDPFGGFQSISRLVKKGGYIIVGLYNKYGRLATDIRRGIFNISGNRFKFLDSRLKKDIGKLKRLTWFEDQYKHPHESKHTFGEVLSWFDKTGFDFINAVPKLTAFSFLTENERLFKVNPRGHWFDHTIVQTGLVFSGIEEGGFFIMIGKRKY